MVLRPDEFLVFSIENVFCTFPVDIFTCNPPISLQSTKYISSRDNIYAASVKLNAQHWWNLAARHWVKKKIARGKKNPKEINKKTCVNQNNKNSIRNLLCYSNALIFYKVRWQKNCPTTPLIVITIFKRLEPSYPC